MKDERNKSDLTELLYEQDGYLSVFSATVVMSEKIDSDKCDDLYAVVLDRTAFFPEGGGQQADEGMIDDVSIFDVQADENGVIRHYYHGNNPFKTGDNVNCSVNFDIRFPRMQNHGAEHIVSGIINKRFGYDNVGFHMSENMVRLDVNGTLTEEQIREIEREANEAVFADADIVISYPDEEEILSLEYRSKLDITEGVRLVTIEGVDTCACCAPHLSSTGQIGIIKILDYEPHRQGMRITMTAGTDAYNDYVKLHDINSRLMALLSSGRDTVDKFADDFMERFNKLRFENTALKREMSAMLSVGVLEKIRNRDENDNTPVTFFTEALDNKGLRELVNTCTQAFSGVVAGFIGNDDDGYKYIIGCSSDADIISLCKKLNESCNGRGGGSGQMVQGSLNSKREIIEKNIADYL